MRLTLTLVDLTQVDYFLMWASLAQLAEGLKSKGTELPFQKSMAQPLRALAAPPEDSGSIPSPYTAAHNSL